MNSISSFKKESILIDVTHPIDFATAIDRLNGNKEFFYIMLERFLEKNLIEMHELAESI